jgi:hypothetical protein
MTMCKLQVTTQWMCILASLKLEGLRIVDWNLKMQIQTLNLKMAITYIEILVNGSGEK